MSSIVTDIAELAVLQSIVAELTVSNLAASVDWYRALGFKLELEGVSDDKGVQWVSMSRNGRSVWLLRRDISRHQAAQSGGVTFYLQVEDVDSLHKQLEARGVRHEEPGNRWYGLREFIAYDPDGFCWAINQSIPPQDCPPRPS